MLTPDQIQQALHAGRVVPLDLRNPHGPLGLEHLAEVVAKLQGQGTELAGRVQRPINLSLEAWEKLERLARGASQTGATPISASELAAALLEKQLVPQ